MHDVDSHISSWYRQVHGWLSRRPLAVDAIFAVLVMVVTSVFLLAAEQSGEIDTIGGTAWVWTVIGAVPVLLRRRLMWWAVGLVLANMAYGYVRFDSWQSASLATLILIYTAAATRGWRVALLVTGLLVAPVPGLLAVAPEDQFGSNSLVVVLLVNYLMIAIAFFVGRTVHTRRVSLQQLRDRARIAEQNQAALAEQAVSDERRRIARELHDVVAHHISVMGVLATGARRVLSTDPVSADEALATIEATGRATLREMRRLLNVLRTDDEQRDDGTELAPQPGLEAVQALIAQIRDTGMHVNLVIDGDPYSLDSGVALTVYRIVQEALTNTLKHAGPARAGVRIGYRPEQVDIEVSDTGLGPSPPVHRPEHVGHGLVGMRERVALYGGTLRTGPRPGGGFRVRAVIPIDRTFATAEAVNGAAS